MILPLLVAGVLAAVPAATKAASEIAGLATDVVGMFNSDYSVQGRDVTLGYTALAAAVEGHLNAAEPEEAGRTIVIDGFMDLHNTTVAGVAGDVQ